MTVKVYCTHHF